VGSLARSEQDVISYALFPQIARPFLERVGRGLGRKEVIAAAVAARLLREYERTNGNGAAATTTANAWKLAGRREPAGTTWGLG
jgi:hypothetical protein